MGRPNLLRRFQLPEIESDFELAEWFRLPLEKLQWFADYRGIERSTRREKLRHYRYRLLEKRFGQLRLIESPKPRLKSMQRCVLQEIVQRIRPHLAVHGFRPRRSIKTNAQMHLGKQVVIRMDLEDFFPSVGIARVRATFATAGYAREVAELLAGLCTNSAPANVLPRTARQSRVAKSQAERYGAPHLPQGAPTSPALANLAAYRLDCRLAGLARAAGATYTRYADDLVFSGDASLNRCANRFCTSVAATAMDEGFVVNFRKTRVMRHDQRQQVAGVVVNSRPNVTRTDYDRLKATLTNCIRHGPESQNRSNHTEWRAHLMGRVAHVAMLNPNRGAKLRKLIDQVVW